MHMILLALAAMPAILPTLDPDPRPAARPALGAKVCRNAQVERVRPAAKPLKPQKLEQEPAAGQYLAVLRLEDGCDKPVKIRDGVGAGPR
jgi:hypothetical protein